MITILTEPSSRWSYKWPRKAKLFLKNNVLGRRVLPYSGHFAVTRSLIEGLQKIGEPFIYNPKDERDITEHVHVLAGVNTLRYAISLKRKSKIKRLTAGPNIVVSSADYDGLVASEEIDAFFVNSEWTKNAYLIDNPRLQDRIDYFTSGVDAEFWNIKKTKRNDLRLLFYKKRADEILYQQCLAIARHFNTQVEEIIYGRYSLNEMRTRLSEADFVVYFGGPESQGIALAEIWSSDTPTVVYNTDVWKYQKKSYASSSAPYLSKETGIFFKNSTEFSDLFKNDLFNIQKFTPRQWVLKNMTDQICAKMFLEKTTGNETD